MQYANSKNETHEESTNVGEIVQSWQKPKNKGDDDVQEDKTEIPFWAGPVLPRVKEVEENDCYDAEERARTSCRGEPVRSEIATHDESKDAGAEVYEEKAKGTDLAFNVPPQRPLQQHVEADVNDATMQKYGHDEPPPLIRLWL